MEYHIVKYRNYEEINIKKSIRTNALFVMTGFYVV